MPEMESVAIRKVNAVIGMMLRQTAHLAHVLLADGVDHRAGAEEEQRLEEGVGEEVEHADGVGVGDREADEHVAELADGRVGQHPS